MEEIEITSNRKQFEVFFPKECDLDTVNKVEIRGREFLPVVRCKDCKWCKKRLADTGLKFVYECFFTKDEVQTLDWFCADGEKR